MKERARTNYDHPDAFDYDLMLSQMESLKAGKSIDVPIYDYLQHNRSAQTLHVNPSRIIIYEGILLLANTDVRKEFDLRFYMDTRWIFA